MKHLMLVILILMGTGCDIDTNNHGYGYDYDRITDLGIEYRNDGYAENALTDEFLNKMFLQVYNCIQSKGQSTTPANPADVSFPINLMVVSVHQIGNTNKEAQHYSNPSLIVLLDKSSPYHITLTSTALKHELVHHILKQLTGWSSPEHISAYFELCV